MKQDSQVSVVIPAYNRAETIERCLRSVINQTLPPHEILVVDDCSTDGTAQAAEKVASPLVRIVRMPRNSGAQAARNAGIKAAVGDWIAFQDSDDEWLPDKLERQLRCALERDCPVVISDGLVVNGSNTAAYRVHDCSGNCYKRLLTGPGPMFITLLAKKVCFETAGFLDERVPAFQEWDTCLLLAKHFPFGHVNAPLYRYHLHGGETISKDAARGARGIEYIVKKHAADIVRVAGRQAYLDHLVNIASRYLQASRHDKWAEYRLLDLRERRDQVRFYVLKAALIRRFPRAYCQLRARYISHKEDQALRLRRQPQT